MIFKNLVRIVFNLLNVFYCFYLYSIPKFTDTHKELAKIVNTNTQLIDLANTITTYKISYQFFLAYWFYVKKVMNSSLQAIG